MDVNEVGMTHERLALHSHAGAWEREINIELTNFRSAQSGRLILHFTGFQAKAFADLTAVGTTKFISRYTLSK